MLIVACNGYGVLKAKKKWKRNKIQYIYLVTKPKIIKNPSRAY
jgi:hypothetical protein